VAESVDGLYTGRLFGGLLHGEAKAAAIQALADREGLDLARCSAYSDSINDLPMLELVGHPSAVNPDADLRAEARTRDWPVYDFRAGRRATLIALPAAAGAGAPSAPPRPRTRGSPAATGTTSTDPPTGTFGTGAPLRAPPGLARRY